MNNQELRDKIKQHNLNGLRLSKDLGLTRQQVYSWINDRHKIGRPWSILLDQHFSMLVNRKGE